MKDRMGMKRKVKRNVYTMVVGGSAAGPKVGGNRPGRIDNDAEPTMLPEGLRICR